MLGGFGSRTYAQLALQAGGPGPAGDPDVVCLALDLIPARLAEIIELVTASAIRAAAEAATALLNAAPDDGHLALRLDSTDPFDRVIDLGAFPAVGGQQAQAQAEAVVFPPGRRLSRARSTARPTSPRRCAASRSSSSTSCCAAPGAAATPRPSTRSSTPAGNPIRLSARPPSPRPRREGPGEPPHHDQRPARPPGSGTYRRPQDQAS
jgi:hypothetical protein